jgi:hypothetical protein
MEETRVMQARLMSSKKDQRGRRVREDRTIEPNQNGPAPTFALHVAGPRWFPVLRGFSGRCRPGALAVALLTVASPAAAAPVGSLSSSLSVLYGNNWSGDPQYDPYGVGLGLNGGLVLPGSFYLGGALRHFFGQKVEYSLFSLPSIDVERTSSLTELIGHLGYELDFAAAALRPSLGVGYSLTSFEVQSTQAGVETSSASTEGAFVLSPGVEARIPIGRVAGCVELRYEALLGGDTDQSALVIGVGIGLDL